jgi:hypothetical protein
VALLDDQQRTAVVNVIDFVPDAVVERQPYHAAVLLAALERLHDEIGQRGMPMTVEQRQRASQTASAVLDAAELARARHDASILTLEGAIDIVAWLASAGSWDEVPIRGGG